MKLVIGLILILTAAFNPLLPAQAPHPGNEENPPGAPPGGLGEPGGKIIEQGTVEAESICQITLPWPKRYVKFLVEEGDFVKKGEPVMEIDARQFQRIMDVTRLNIAALEAKLKAMEKVTIPLRKLELRSARWEAKQMKEKTRLELNAREKMFKENLSSAQQLEEAHSAFEMAKLKAEGINLQLSHFEDGPDMANIINLKARLKDSRNRMLDMEDTTGEEARKASHAGKVLYTSELAKKLFFPPGTANKENEKPLAEPNNVTIGKVAQVIISTYIYQADISWIRIGGQALVRADYASGCTFSGKITHISPSAITRGSTSVFMVKTLVENKEDILKPGTTVEVTFLTRAEK